MAVQEITAKQLSITSVGNNDYQWHTACLEQVDYTLQEESTVVIITPAPAAWTWQLAATASLHMDESIQQ